MSPHFSYPEKMNEQRGIASFLSEDGRVWNASKFQTVHPETAEELITDYPSLLEWTLPQPDPRSLQGNALPAAEKHATSPSTSRKEETVQSHNSEPQRTESSLQRQNTTRKSARVRKSLAKFGAYTLRKR